MLPHNLAPIALFVYNRVNHLKKTIESLVENKHAEKSLLYIFSDGPKHDTDASDVNQVRHYLKTITGFKKVIINESPNNKGLANSIIAGVTDILSQYERVIVLEDDLVTSPYFLDYMNQGLELYSSDTQVASIHGYTYPTKNTLPDTFFLRGADCWGWATWKDRWSIFESNGPYLLDRLKKTNQTYAFDFNGTYPFTNMLEDQINGKNDSWAVRWHASTFLENKLTLYPGLSFVQNIGNDNTGTHCSQTQSFNVELNTVGFHPLTKVTIKESTPGKLEYIDFFNSGLKKKNKLFNFKFLFSFFKKLFNFNKQQHYGWLDEYDNWAEVEAQTTGYDQPAILKKCHSALLAVKRGEAIHERDSVLFDKIQYSWPLLAGLLYAYTIKHRLSILDFGGSLGTTYFQNRKFLSHFSLTWGIVEQPHFVEAGQRDFQNERLMYFYTIESCIKRNDPNVLLLSSVIQYFEFPYQQLDLLMVHQYDVIIIDRTPFNKKQKESVRLQVVPPVIYTASYPCWFFNYDKFIAYFHKYGYSLIESFKALDGDSTEDYEFKGIIFKRNNS